MNKKTIKIDKGARNLAGKAVERAEYLMGLFDEMFSRADLAWYLAKADENLTRAEVLGADVVKLRGRLTMLQELSYQGRNFGRDYSPGPKRNSA